MLQNQLNKLRMTQQIHEIKPSKNIHFSDSEYLDNETLFEMITLQTEYTSKKYKHFDRYKLTRQKEIQFNQKFKKYIKGLLIHRKDESFIYILDLLVRNFHADMFNAEELIFLILPSHEFEKQVSHLRKRVAFLENYNFHDSHYFAKQILKDSYFFDLFLEYFNYFEHVSVFIENVVKELCFLNGFAKSLERVYNLLYELSESKCVDMFFMLYETVEKECDLSEEFINLKKSVEQLHGVNLIKEKFMENNKETTKIFKIESCNKEIVDVKEIIKSFEVHSKIDLLKVRDCLLNTTERDVLIKYIGNRLGVCKIHELFKILYINDVRFIGSYITIHNISQLLDAYTDAVLEYLPREFIYSNILLIFRMIIEKDKAAFFYLKDYLTYEIIFNYEYNTEISRVNLIKIFKCMNIDYIEFIFSKNLLDINIIIFLLAEENEFSNAQLLIIFEKVKETNDEYLSRLFLIKISTIIINQEILKSILHYYIDNNAFNILIVGILELYYEKYDFVRKMSINYIRNKSFKEIVFLIRKVSETEKDYVCDVLLLQNNELLVEILKFIPFEKIINGDNNLFITNFIRIRDSFQTLIESAKIYIEENEVLNINIRKFVGLSLENSNVLLNETVDVFISNEVFYTNLFYFYENKISKILIEEGLNNHRQIYNKIFVIISSDVVRFLNLYFDLYLQIKQELEIDENSIINMANDYNLDDRMVLNYNILLKEALIRKNINFNNMDKIIRYCDELNLLTLITTYKNILVPYLEVIISRFVENMVVFRELQQIDGIFVLKALDSLYNESKNDGYLNLMSIFFERNTNTDQKMVIKYFSLNIEKYYKFTDLISRFLVYASLNKTEQTMIQKVIDNYDRETLYKIFIYVLKHDNLYFSDYIEDYLQEIVLQRFEHIECVTLYFKHNVNINLDISLIHDVTYILFNNYLKSKNVLLVDCLCGLLNYDKDHTKIQEINLIILKQIKNEGAIEMFDLLNVLFEKVENYIACMRESVPYYSLFLDHKNKNIQKAMKCLLSNIEKYTNENPYNYFD